MEQIPQAVMDGAAGMSQATMLWIMGALVTVITTLGGIVTAQYNKRTNPINGALVRLDTTLRQVDTTLTKVDMRAEDSNRVLVGHTEKLILMSTSVSQLAANEAEQTRALLQLQPAIDKAMTGVASRITDHCNNRSTAILKALDNG